MADDQRPCRTPDCANTVSVNIGLEFCFNCSARLHKEINELWDDLAKVLRLEAAFVRYCEEHGLPHPHE